MEKKIKQIKERFLELEKQLKDPLLSQNQQKLQKISKEHSELSKIVERIKKLESLEKQAKENEEIISEDEDKELVEIAQSEQEKIKEEKITIEKQLKIDFLPKDANDAKNVIVEIRPAAGGDESTLFAEELYKMYFSYATKNGWDIEILSSSKQEVGGFKEIIFRVAGNNVYSKLKYESGVHRVQRVPKTESKGRVHTSTVTVAVLPEAEEVELEIKPENLRIDVFRSSGPGGQSVNTTDSAVRITYTPTGMVVSCQDEKSQIKNKDKALKILRSRLLAEKEEKLQKEQGVTRKNQIGTGDRSEKIRTYNFPQSRITDHRINYTTRSLEKIMSGYLKELINNLEQENQKKLLSSENDN